MCRFKLRQSKIYKTDTGLVLNDLTLQVPFYFDTESELIDCMLSQMNYDRICSILKVYGYKIFESRELS